MSSSSVSSAITHFVFKILDYPGVWRHGDWIKITSRGSTIIAGRSDSTLNRLGVRIGSAEIYAAVEDLPEVAESLIVGF